MYANFSEKKIKILNNLGLCLKILNWCKILKKNLSKSLEKKIKYINKLVTQKRIKKILSIYKKIMKEKEAKRKHNK